jgi:hypothetical protein
VVLSAKDSADALEGQVRANGIFVSIFIPVKSLHFGEKYHRVTIFGLSFSPRAATVFDSLLDVSPYIRGVISVKIYYFLCNNRVFVLFGGLDIFAGLL